MSIENIGTLIDQASLREKEWQQIHNTLLKVALCVSVLALSYLTIQSILHSDPYFSFRGIGGLTGAGGITALYATCAINLLLVGFAIFSVRQSAQFRKEREDLTQKQIEHADLEKGSVEKPLESEATIPASSSIISSTQTESPPPSVAETNLSVAPPSSLIEPSIASAVTLFTEEREDLTQKQIEHSDLEKGPVEKPLESEATIPASNSTSSTQTESPSPSVAETNLSVAPPSSLIEQPTAPAVTLLTTKKTHHSLRPKLLNNKKITFIITPARRDNFLRAALSQREQWNFSMRNLILQTHNSHSYSPSSLSIQNCIPQQSQTTQFVGSIPSLVLTKKAHSKEIFVIPALTKLFSSSCARKLNSTEDQILLFLSQQQGDKHSSAIVGSDNELRVFTSPNTFNQNKSHTSPPPFIPIKASAPSTFSTQLFSSTLVGANPTSVNSSASSSFSTSSIILPMMGMFSSSILSITASTPSSSMAKQPAMTIQKLEEQITKIISSIKGLLESMIRCEYSRNVPGWLSRRSNLEDRLQALNGFFQGIEKSYLPTKNLQMSVKAILVSLSYERLLNVKMKALKAIFNQVCVGGKGAELFQPCLRQCEALIKYRNGLTQACQVFSNQSSSINDVRDAVVAIFEGLKLAYKTEPQFPLVDSIVTFLEKKLSSLIQHENVANKLLSLKMKTEDELFSGILDTLLEALTPKELETWLIQNESSIVEGVSRTIKTNLAKFQIPLHLFLRDTLPLFQGENPGPNFSAHFHQVFQAHLLLEGNSKVSQQKELEQLAELETHEADNLALIVIPEDQVLTFNFDQWVQQKPQSLFSTITSETRPQDIAKCKEKGLIEITLKNNKKVHAAFVPSPGRLDFGISWTQFTGLQWITFGTLKSLLGITSEQMPIISNLFDALINALYYGAIAPVEGYPFEGFRVQIAKFVQQIDPTMPLDQLVGSFEKFLKPLTKTFQTSTSA